MRASVPRRWAAFACLLALSACATAPLGGGQPGFADWAEAVFRHQNELSSRLLMLSEADKLPDSEEYDRAEEAMGEACHLLNEYAEREGSGADISLAFKIKVQGSVAGCDQSIQRLERVLGKYGLFP